MGERNHSGEQGVFDLRQMLDRCVASASAVIISSVAVIVGVTAVSAGPTATAGAVTAAGIDVSARAGLSAGPGILWESDADQTRDLDEIAASGAKWINIDIDWNHIQDDGPTVWRWNAATDRVVLNARARPQHHRHRRVQPHLGAHGGLPAGEPALPRREP